MSGAVFRAMLLGLLRDRGALAMAFLLPAALFLVMAVIFASASGEELRLKLAVVDEVGDETSSRLLRALRTDPSLYILDRPELTADDLRELVRRGTADVGLIVRAEARGLGDLAGFGPAPLVIVSDPVRGVAAPMLAGQIQRAYFEALPDVALDGVVGLLENQFFELEETQRADLDEGFAEIREESIASAELGQKSGWGFQELTAVEEVAGAGGRVNHVAYYAGAVAALFVLFSAANGAVSLLEERDSGIVDRVLAGPGRFAVLIHGKFLFLTLQGFVQIGVIFVVAWLGYGVDLPGNLGPWSVITLVQAAAAAGIGLVVASACGTVRQAHNLATVAILLASALGGSMVPRFLMPAWLQDMGWATPNTWAIEAYSSVFWLQEGWSRLPLPVAMLAVMALGGLMLSRYLARRRETL